MTLNDILSAFPSLINDAVAIAQFSADGNDAHLVHVNPAFTELFGRTVEDALTQPLSSVHDPDGWPAFAERLSALVAEGQSRCQLEVRARRADGTAFWASLALSVCAPQSDHARIMIAVYRDIDDLVRQRLAAEAREERLLQAINSFPDPFVVYGPDEELVACNRAYAESGALDPDRIQPGMRFRDVASIAFDDGLAPEPPEGREAFFDRMQEGTRSGESSADIELSGDRHERVRRNVSPSGDIIILRADITEAVRQRRAAEAAQRRLLDALNAVPDPFVIYENDGKLVACNRAYAAIVAKDPSRIKPGMTFREVKHITLDDGLEPEPPEGREAFFERIESSARSGANIEHLELSGDRHQRVSRSVSGSGDVIILRTDITEPVRQRREAQAAQRKAEEAQRRLISAMNTFPDPFVIYDKDGYLVTCNQAYRNEMATSPDKVQPGMHFRDVVNQAIDDGRVQEPAQGRDAFMTELWNSALQGERVRDVQFGPDLHYRALRSVSEDGDVATIRLDISELVKQRRAAEAAEIRLMAAIDAYPDPFVIYDKDRKLVVCNSAYAAMMSKEPDFLKPGMPFRDIYMHAVENGLAILPPEGLEAFSEKFEKLAADRVEGADLEMPGDVHHRVIRRVTDTGDAVSLRINVTDFVRQRRAAEETQSRLMATLNAYPHPFVIYDRDSRLVACNSSYEKSMSTKPDTIRPGMSFRDILAVAIEDGLTPYPPEGLDAHVARMVRSLDNGFHSFNLELPNGLHHRIIRSRSENGDHLALRIDVTELVHQRHAAEQAQREAEKAQERLLSAINAYPGPICIYDADNRLLFFNEPYAAGYSKDPSEIRAGMDVRAVLAVALQNRKIADAVGREDEWLEDYMDSLQNPSPVEDLELAGDVHHRVFRSRSKNNDLITVRLDMTEQVRQQRAVQQYAARLEEANAEIMFKAYHDELTGLGNRRYIIEKIEEFRRQQMHAGGVLSALHIDLDRFKQINDTIGHAAGDHVLTVVADRIRELADPDDAVARIGGDEFVVLNWHATSSDRTRILAQTLVEAMYEPTVFEGRECRFGASAGIAHTPIVDVNELLTSSDIALYKAKRSGRGRVAVFDAGDVEEMQKTKSLADDVIRGLEAGEFIPYYQPQIDARSGELVGLEALARWEHPKRGILAPAEFLAAATDLSIVPEIDRMVFEKAITECTDIFGAGEVYPKLSFNVSARRVSDGQLEDISRRILQYPGQVSFELLETIFMEEEDDAFLFQLDQLRERGVSIEVDDFGSGRASIMALQRIAPDRLKIDGRLVRPICESEGAARLVKSILEIGHALSIEVIAEGVETAAHASILLEIGVHCLQGFHFSRPLSASDLRAYIKSLGFDHDTIRRRSS